MLVFALVRHTVIIISEPTLAVGAVTKAFLKLDVFCFSDFHFSLSLASLLKHIQDVSANLRQTLKKA